MAEKKGDERAAGVTADVDDDDGGQVAMDEKGQAKEATLIKTLGIPAGISMVCGIIIGSGIFLSPTSILRNTDSVGLSLMVWLVSGVISFLTSLCFIELGLMIPLSGSNHPYLTRGLSPLFGFLFSWTFVFIVKPSSSAAITYALAVYVLQPFYSGGQDSIPGWQIKLIASLVMVSLSILNSVSLKGAARFQIVFTVTKVLGLAVIIVAGMVGLGQGRTNSFENAFDGSTYNIGDLSFATYAGLWAFSGWSNLNFSVEEIKNVNRTLPISIIISMFLVTVLYLLTNVSYLSVLSKEEMLTSGAVAVLFGNKILGVMSWCIPVFVACSTLGSANAGIFSRGRMIFAAAREGHLPRVFGMVQTRFHTPIMGILLNMVLAIIFLIPRGSDFDKLVGYLSFSTWLFHGLTIIALLRMRFTEPNLNRPYKVWFVIPVISLAACFFLVIATFVKNAAETTVACVFILLGVPVYYVFVLKDLSPNCLRGAMDWLTMLIQKTLGVAATTDEKAEQFGEVKKQKPRDTNQNVVMAVSAL